MTKYLVVGNQTLGSRELRAALKERTGPDVHVHLVVPQTPLDHYTSPVDGHEETMAEHQLALALADFADLDLMVTGEVGETDPLMAATIVADRWEPDQAILSTFPEGASRWLRSNPVAKLERILGVPVLHVEGRSFDEDRRKALRYAELRREMGLA